MEKINISIDGKKVQASAGQTIFQTARENGISIPSLCYHPDLEVKAICRLCLVEIKGRSGLVTSCSTKVEDGMEIVTESSRINKARKINLELIMTNNPDLKLLDLAEKYKIKVRFKDRKKDFPKCSFGPSVSFDSAKCIDCRNCLSVCALQEVGFWEIRKKDTFREPDPSLSANKDCVYCGQCIVHCPVGALRPKENITDVERELKDKKKKVIFQFAPSIRSSIGEEFGLPQGSVVTEKLVAGLKKLGAYKVFDTSVGADFTTVEEAKELLEKVKKGTGPCMTSCCPAWVKFIEFYYPEFIGNLATTRSPQILMGGLIKTYFADKEKIDPKNIVVVSVMPCVAKKYEAERKELFIKELKPVDYVLSTRELADLFKKRKIDFKNISPVKADDPFGIFSGAGVIFGASGGVIESALRTAISLALPNAIPKIEFKEVRGLEGLKKAEIRLGEKVLKLAVANGLKNAKIILEELKLNPKAYDGVEVMACFGGCIGGGGQPTLADNKIRQKRAESLYDIDSKEELRMAQDNLVVKEVYRDFLNSEERIHSICHTEYFPKKREVKFNKDELR